MAKLIVVSKDNGDTKMLLPIAKEAKVRKRHKVRVFAEGMGVLQYAAAGITPYFKDEPKPDPKVEFNWEEVFEDIKPNVVLVGFPGPTNNSRAAALAANAANIPVVGVEDYWGGVKCNPEIKYSLILTIDEYAAELAVEAVWQEVRVAVVGNHAIPSEDYKSPEAVLECMKDIRSRFKEVFVFGGGAGKHTTEELKLLVQSLLMTTGDWCLIPRYHPNWKKKKAGEIGDDRLFVEVWDELLLPLGDRVVRLDAGDTDDMAVLCDAYFSGLGSSMSTAVSRGKPTVVVLTEATKEEIKKAKLEAVPAVELGGAKTLTDAQDLRPLLVKSPKSVQKKFRPLDANLAVDEVELLLAQ